MSRRVFAAFVVTFAIFTLLFLPGRLESPVGSLLRESWERGISNFAPGEEPEAELLACFAEFARNLNAPEGVKVESEDAYFIQRMTGALYPTVRIDSKSHLAVINTNEISAPEGAITLASRDCESVQLELVSLG